MHRTLVLAGLLGVFTACLNPDISDEYPLTTEAAALDFGDGGVEIDESAEDDVRADDGERAADDSAADDSAAPGTSAPDAENRFRRRGSTARR
jgi:hypothetical protein